MKPESNGPESRDANVELELELLLQEIYSKYHYDFRLYARPSLARRLERARLIRGFRSLADLRARILLDPVLFTELLDSLTVQVSTLFRDPGYFRALRRDVFPQLRSYPSIRLWVAGCSAGEEAYSLAILLEEEGLLERSLIYATDINPSALERAEAGVFGFDRLSEFTENYELSGGKATLSRYYTTAYERAVFERSLRERIVFADHSLATDSVFAEVQLVSCRNVLIYFEKELQNRAVGLFEEALCHRGFLGLGSKETLRFGLHQRSFSDFVAGERIYRKEAPKRA